jgi:hypothetical protein
MTRSAGKKRVGSASASDDKKQKKSSSSPSSVIPIIKVEPEDTSNHKYFIFTLENGTFECFDNREDADEYFEEFGVVVSERKSFATKRAYNDYKKMLDKQKAAAFQTPKSKVVKLDEKMSPAEIASVEKVKRRLDNSKPKNRCDVYWKTSKRSKCVIILVRFKDTLGKDFWTLKPMHLCTCMRSYLPDFPVDNPEIQYALTNLDTLRMRDPNGGPNSVVCNVSKKGGNERKFDEHVVFSHFILPDNIESECEETAYIQDTCAKIGEALKSIQSAPAYQSVLQHFVSPRFWPMMTSPNSGPSFFEYVKDVKVNVIPLENMNTHAVLDDTKRLAELLLAHSTTSKKYPGDVMTITDRDDKDDSDGAVDVGDAEATNVNAMDETLLTNLGGVETGETTK